MSESVDITFVYSDMLWRNALMSCRDAKLAEFKKMKTLEIDISKSKLKRLRVLRYLCNLCEIFSIVLLWMPIPLVVLLKMKITILSAKYTESDAFDIFVPHSNKN